MTHIHHHTKQQSSKPVWKQTFRHIHMVGIKGVAMTSLAVYLKESGVNVTGTDVSDHFPTDEILKHIGITPYIGFDPSHITKTVDAVVYTGAHHGRENPEVTFSEKQNIPVFPHSKALGQCMKTSRQISVAGCHGKTTTSAMIATILTEGNFDPSYAIGCGSIEPLGNPGHKGQGEWFVAEADEYVTDPFHDMTPRFFFQDPEYFVVTNIDYDHPDVYPDITAIKQQFLRFIKNRTKLTRIFYNADDIHSKIFDELDIQRIRFGFSHDADYRPVNVEYAMGKTRFLLLHNNTELGYVELSVPGMHNVLNATASAAVGLEAGVLWDKVTQGLIQFKGTKRRCNHIATLGSVDFFDDYAHHPKEIRSTLSGLHLSFPNRRIVAVFQPHTFTRTKALIGDFIESFRDAGAVCITDIYASAREHRINNFSGEDVVEAMKSHHSLVQYTNDMHDVTDALKQLLRPNDLVVFMGAGDIYNWEGPIIQSLKQSIHI